MASLFKKKTGVKLELLPDIDMLLMVEKGIRERICHAIYKHAKANNNKYMKNYDKNTESSYLMYLDANNLYGSAMSQKLPVNGFKWIKNISNFDEEFIKNYDENSNKGYSFEVDVEYSNNLLNLHGNLTFLGEGNKIYKCKKLVCNINDKENYIVHIRALKQVLNHGLIPRKVHRVIQFNQKAWLKQYIDMNTKLRTEAKNDFEKDFFKLMNNAVFGKTMENVRKHRDMKLVTTDKRINQLVSETNYHTTNCLAIEMKKIKVKMNKSVYLGMSILDISKTLIMDFGMIISNRNIKTMQNYVTWILAPLLFILKLRIFMKILLMMLKNGLIHQTIMKMIKDCFQ